MTDISILLRDADWDRNEPAKPELVRQLAGTSVEKLPDEYLALLLYSDGGEGKLAIDPGWLQLWPVAEVSNMNKGCDLLTEQPGYFGFGSNGGGELLAFDFNHEKPYRVVMIPFISISEKDAVIIANDFVEFIQAIGRETK